MVLHAALDDHYLIDTPGCNSYTPPANKVPEIRHVPVKAMRPNQGRAFLTAILGN
jgi:hypothetical protein